MSFLYYLPGPKTKPTPEAIEAAGLAYAFDKPPEFWGCDRGPDGQPGVVLSAGVANRFKPGIQNWSAIPGTAASVWIGMPKGQSIAPDELLRGDALPGRGIKLADGNTWVVPIVRAALPETGKPYVYAINLPQRSTRDEDGYWVPGPVLNQYKPLWEIATAWHGHYFATPVGEDEEPGGIAKDPFEGDGAFDHLHTAAIDALAFNYRLGAAEADLLGLLTHETAIDVMHTTIDISTRLLIVAANRKAIEETPAA